MVVAAVLVFVLIGVVDPVVGGVAVVAAVVVVRYLSLLLSLSSPPAQRVPRALRRRSARARRTRGVACGRVRTRPLSFVIFCLFLVSCTNAPEGALVLAVPYKKAPGCK